MLLSAEKPVIVVGQGVRYGGAADELLALAERLQIPVASSASGLGAIPVQHPLSLGWCSVAALTNQTTLVGKPMFCWRLGSDLMTAPPALGFLAILLPSRQQD